MLKGKITISYDKNFDVPMAEIDFNGFYLAFVRICSKREDDYFSLTIQEIDTVFYKCITN